VASDVNNALPFAKFLEGFQFLFGDGNCLLVGSLQGFVCSHGRRFSPRSRAFWAAMSAITAAFSALAACFVRDALF
jgi:hypothetical protein